MAILEHKDDTNNFRSTLAQVPDSPAWLVTKGRVRDAEKAYQWLRGWVRLEDVKYELASIVDYVKETQGVQLVYSVEYAGVQINENPKAKVPKNRLQLLTKLEATIPFRIIVLYLITMACISLLAMKPFFIEILETIGTPIKSHAILAICGSLQTAGAICCGICMRLIGKRRLSFLSLGLCTLSCLGLGGRLTFRPNYTRIPVTLFFLSYFAGPLGIALIPWVLIMELFPLRARGMHSGICGACAHGIFFTTTKTYNSLVNVVGISRACYFYGAVEFLVLSLSLLLHRARGMPRGMYGACAHGVFCTTTKTYNSLVNVVGISRACYFYGAVEFLVLSLSLLLHRARGMPRGMYGACAHGVFCTTTKTYNSLVNVVGISRACYFYGAVEFLVLSLSLLLHRARGMPRGMYGACAHGVFCTTTKTYNSLVNVVGISRACYFYGAVEFLVLSLSLLLHRARGMPRGMYGACAHGVFCTTTKTYNSLVNVVGISRACYFYGAVEFLVLSLSLLLHRARGMPRGMYGACAHGVFCTTTKTYYSLVNLVGISGACYFYGTVGVVRFIYFYWDLPETESISLEEIEQKIIERRNSIQY